MKFTLPWRSAILGLGAVVVLVLTAGCGASSSSALSATQLGKPVSMPAGVFTDTAGQPYNLKTQSRNRLTLLYFGYTNCPDICPTTMADLGSAIRSLPTKVADDVQVVFVTSDPARDTPAVIGKWLANFDNHVPHPFIGLRTGVAQVDAYAKKLGVPLQPPVTEKDGSIEVTHGAQTVAFLPHTEQADYVWLPGTTPQQYANDITQLENSNTT